MKLKKLAIIVAAFAFIITGSISTFAVVNHVSDNKTYLKLQEAVYYPKNRTGKLPVVFMAHNGLEDNSAWGDYPQQIADAGFFTVNITYKSWDTTEVETAIQYALNKYEDKIDTDNVSFIGGCHGGKDLIQIMSQSNLDYKVKCAAFLSIAENDQSVIDSQKVKHAPILAYYSKKDELGAYYQDITKKIAEETITQPKKVVALDEAAHGDHVVTSASCKDQVRKDIIDWIKSYTKK
jgi:hypothetical protein